MFSTKKQLIIKTGKDGVERRDYLKQLAAEFHKSNSHEAKQQVLSNLANFAYDPINYEFMRDLKILDLFLAQLSSNEEELLHFGIAGLCNLSLDPLNRDYIIRSNGVLSISRHLLHKNKEIALNALTTLISLITLETQGTITCPEIINKVLQLVHNSNPRCRNLGLIFLQDYCTQEQIECARQYKSEVANIPLPY